MKGGKTDGKKDKTERKKERQTDREGNMGNTRACDRVQQTEWQILPKLA